MSLMQTIPTLPNWFSGRILLIKLLPARVTDLITVKFASLMTTNTKT